jgi:hypothetical protein
LGTVSTVFGQYPAHRASGPLVIYITYIIRHNGLGDAS